MKSSPVYRLLSTAYLFRRKPLADQSRHGSSLSTDVTPPRHPLEEHLAAVWPPNAWRDVGVLVTVSGGADSTALLCAMAHLHQGATIPLCVAHFNHHLRGAESAADEQFVRGLAARLGLECRLGQAGDGWSGRGGVETAARLARYDFFRQTAEECGARYVVTAHTADDQAETILHRILRGTGIAGLAGISRARSLGHAATVIRPFLGIRHAEVVDYLAALGQTYRSDTSNADLRYTRNRIRHQLLPQLREQYNPGVIEALIRLGTLAGEVQTVVDTLVDDLAEQCIREDQPGQVRIAVSCLAMQPQYVLRELLLSTWRREGWPLQAMGFAQWNQLADMIYRNVGHTPKRRQMFPGTVAATIQDEELWLERE